MAAPRLAHEPPAATPRPLRLFDVGPDRTLCSEALERAAYEEALHLHPSPAAEDAMRASARALDALVARGAPIYGITTGFGPHVRHAAAEGDEAHSAGLIAHLAAGTGAWAPPPIVRATIILRAQALAQGHSGVAPELIGTLGQLLAHNLIPAVPEIGSVGASGDLTPLAHVARALMGDGYILQEGTAVPSRDALQAAGLAPARLARREALGLVNGVSFSAAFATLALVRARRLLRYAERLTGWLYRLLGCSREALDARLHAARGHEGQQQSAAAIRAEAESGPTAPPNGRLQEIYSLRCAPQILGACRENLAFARRLIEAEINGASDNPVIDPAAPAVLHGGNFQGQQLAFAADALTAALTQVGVLVDRQIDALVNPQAGANGNAPLLLAWRPGATSGLAGAQITASALVAELRHHAQMASTASVPTNAGNQDVVSMSTLAARNAYYQTERLAPIVAVGALALRQLTFLRAEGRAQGPALPLPTWMPEVAPLREDRPLHSDLQALATAWLDPRGRN